MEMTWRTMVTGVTGVIAMTLCAFDDLGGAQTTSIQLTLRSCLVHHHCQQDC